MQRKHLDITVTGKVQGVGFRAAAKEEADKLGLYGYARNMREGHVEIVAEGPEEAIEQFLAWCSEGSYHAKVDQVNSSDLKDIEGHREFKTY